MAPKLQLDKAAWQWAETTDPENVTYEHIQIAYRTNLKPCPLGSCRRNCKGNPFCLNGLGEKDWLIDKDDENWYEIEDPNTERRKEGAFVGLRNLGATCYVNSFVQVWYHNKELRNAIYQLTPEIQNDDVTVENMEKEAIDEVPSTVCGHLQLIFALLQASKRRYIDPSQFIKILGLNTAQQQDAQEFSKLLMSLLEVTLSKHQIPEFRNIIQDQFCGEYSYVTTCNGCSAVSYNKSTFYELVLNIKDHTDLEECLQEFLEEEKLEGLNQYACTACNSRQNASHKIVLNRLPPVLNLQLLRFVFDRQIGHKKKINSFIKFPEVLNMNKYLSTPDLECIYDLSAVLIHRGPSAFSGHYIAHIKDKTNSHWYKFNDEETEKMEGKKLQLGCEEDIQGTVPDGEDGKSVKKPKLASGIHASKSAYMLVYNRRLSEASFAVPENEIKIPEKLLNLVEKDNIKFEEWVQEITHMRELNVQKAKAKQNEIKELYDLLPISNDDVYEWISKDWLSSWFTDYPLENVNNTSFLCSHSKINPDEVTKLKCISPEAANIVYSKYKGGPRLTKDFFCKECVVSRCRLIRMKAKITEDNKTINHLLKLKCDSGPSYWVGKASLRSWQRLVLEQFQDSVEDSGISENLSEDTKDDIATGDKIIKDEINFEQDEELHFNEDIICQHKNLCIEDNRRRLVHNNVWYILKKYFPNCPQFSNDDELCEKCQLSCVEDRQTKVLHKSIAIEQKTALADLYLDKNRPILSQVHQQVFVVSQEFLNSWRKFIRDPFRKDPITHINNLMLICIHGGFIGLEKQELESKDNNLICFIWPHEWEIISKSFEVDEEISINYHSKEGDSLTSHIVVTPATCEECLCNKIATKNQLKLEYPSAKIYVRRIMNTRKSGVEPSPLVETSEPEDFDPEFTQAQSKKKKKLNDGSDKGQKYESQIRRSTRHRKTRNEKDITVSSSITLKELKLLIMKQFSVAPFDQHLSVNGVELIDLNKTLSELKIAPESLVLLKVDEPTEDSYIVDDFLKASTPEEGFKGTSLLSI